MPLTEKGKKIKKAMQEKYGETKGESIFYASKNKGTITGVDGVELTWDSADELWTEDRRKKVTERDPMGRVKGTYEEDAWSSQAREASARARSKGASTEPTMRGEPGAHHVLTNAGFEHHSSNDKLDSYQRYTHAKGTTYEAAKTHLESAGFHESLMGRERAGLQKMYGGTHETSFSRVNQPYHEESVSLQSKDGKTIASATHYRGDLSRDSATDAWSKEAREAAARVRAGRKTYKKENKIGKMLEEHKKKFTAEARRLGHGPLTGRPLSEIGRGTAPDTAEQERFHRRERDPAGGFKFGRGRAPDSDSVEDELVKIVGDAEGSSLMMYDTVELDDAAKVRVIDGGYLVATPRIARTGVQVYKGVECQRDDVETVRVYRPQDEVFRDATVRGYTHLPVTLGHPKVMVTAKNWKEYAVGDTGDEVLRDGTSVRVPMMLRDAAAVEAYKQGTNQLSVGYQCELEWKPGITEDGEEYDAVQRGITPNHLAVVANARGGSSLRIGDDRAADDTYSQYAKGDTAMNLKTVMVDGIECQMSDTAASVVQRTVERLQDQVENFKKKAKDKDDEDEEKSKKDEAFAAEVKKVIDARDGEIAALKAQLKDATDPAKIDLQIKDRQVVVDKARSILGDKLTVDGKTLDDIRRQVVEAKLGAAAIKDWNPGKVEGAFDAFIGTGGGTTGRVADAAAAFSRPHFAAFTDEREKAYAEAELRDQNAWKGEKKTA